MVVLTASWFPFDEIGRADIVAFDIEAAARYIKFLNPYGNMWDEPKPTGELGELSEDEKKALLPKAAYITVVNSKREVVFDRKVKHLPGTFVVDYFSKTIANIHSETQLEDGSPFKEVVESFLQLFGKKIHITCGGACDYRYLEQCPSFFKSFDLQGFYMRRSIENPQKTEPMSLRDIYFYHFKVDFQRGAHDCSKDAKATMKVFTEGYRRLDRSKNYLDEFTDSPNLKKLAKKSLFWCLRLQQFARKCSCKECLNVEI